jgi:hypothetical protein
VTHNAGSVLTDLPNWGDTEGVSWRGCRPKGGWVGATIKLALITACAPLVFAGICSTGSASAAAPQPLNGPTLFGKTNWEAVPLPFQASTDLLLACITASECIASDDNESNGATFIKTLDGGITWSDDGSYGSGIGDLSCVSTGFCMAVPYDDDQHLVVSNQPSTTWTPISQPPFRPGNLTATTVACIRAFCIVIGGDNNGNIPPHGVAAFLTSDHGTTWTPIKLPPPTKDIQALSCTPNGTCYLVYDTYTDQFSDIAESTNRGGSWSAINHAGGFTSKGGFSCPTNGSCVYLATQLFEVSSGSRPVWETEYGPFTPHKQNGSISAFTLSCTAVSQCMIGGGIAGASPDQVVWIEATQWSARKIAKNLRSTVLKTTVSFSDAIAQLHEPSNSTLADFNNLVSVVQSNMASIAHISIHARGSQQIQVGAIGKAWGAILGTLRQIPVDLASGNDPATEQSKLISEIRGLAVAQHKAGVKSNLQLPTSVAA